MTARRESPAQPKPTYDHYLHNPHLVHIPITKATVRKVPPVPLARRCASSRSPPTAALRATARALMRTNLDVCSAVINKVLQPEFIGRDPFQTEKMWETLYYGSLVRTLGSRQHRAFAALSGIDIALWDIKGKALKGASVQLFGGFAQDSVRPYAPRCHGTSIHARR